VHGVMLVSREAALGIGRYGCEDTVKIDSTGSLI
jgi:hypothetical protein